MSPRTATLFVRALTATAILLAAFGFASVVADGSNTKVWGVALISVGLAIRTLQLHGRRVADAAR